MCEQIEEEMWGEWGGFLWQEAHQEVEETAPRYGTWRNGHWPCVILLCLATGNALSISTIANNVSPDLVKKETKSPKELCPTTPAPLSCDSTGSGSGRGSTEHQQAKEGDTASSDTKLVERKKLHLGTMLEEVTPDYVSSYLV